MAVPASLDQIEAEERRLGRRLPEALRRRLLRDNGGEVETDESYGGSDPLDNRWDMVGVEHTVRDKKGRGEWRSGGMAAALKSLRETFGDLFDVPEGTVVLGYAEADVLVLLPDDRYAWWDHELGDLNPVGVRLFANEGDFETRAM